MQGRETSYSDSHIHGLHPRFRLSGHGIEKFDRLSGSGIRKTLKFKHMNTKWSNVSILRPPWRNPSCNLGKSVNHDADNNPESTVPMSAAISGGLNLEENGITNSKRYESKTRRKK